MKLTNENYYSSEANKQYWSVSQVKQFLNCEAQAMAELNGEYHNEPNAAMMVGSYVDAYFSGEMEEFIEKHPEVYTAKGTLKADFKLAEKMIDRATQDPLFMRMMAGDKQAIVTGEIAGSKFKAKLDVLQSEKDVKKTAKEFPGMGELLFAEGAIIDLKTVKDFKPVYVEEEGRLSFIEAWKYDLQLAVYQELVRQKTGKKLPCYIVAVTRENEPDIGLFALDQAQMDAQLEWLKEQMPTLELIKKAAQKPLNCGECAYCRRTKKLTAPMTVGMMF